MTDLEQQKRLIITQEQQIARAKETAAAEKAKTEQVQQQINAARANLESVRAMRSQGGIEGLRKRQLASGQLSQSQSQVSARQQDISGYESQISSAEQALKPVKEQVQAMDEEQQAYNLAQQAQDNPYLAMGLKGRALEIYRGTQTTTGLNIEKDSSGNVIIPVELQKNLDYLKSKGITGEQALNVTGFTSKLGTGINGTNTKVDTLPATNLPAITGQAKVLNAQNATVRNGFGSSGGAYNLSNISLSSTQPSSNISGSWVNRVISTVQKDISKDKIPNYVSGLGDTGAYVIPSQAGAKGTVIATPVGGVDLQRKQELQNLGTFSTQLKLLTSQPAGQTQIPQVALDIAERNRQINDLTRNFSNLNETEQQSRLQQLSKIGVTVNEQGNLRTPTVGIGIGNFKRQIPIERFGENPIGVILNAPVEFLRPKEQESTKTYNPFTSEEISNYRETVATTYPANIKADWIITTPEQNINVTLPFQQRGTSFSNQQGFFAPTTKVIIPEKKINVNELTTNVALGAVRVAPYAALGLVNPILGTGLFASEKGLDIAKGIGRYGVLKGVGTSITEDPLGIGLLGVGGLVEAYNFAFKPIVEKLPRGVSRSVIEVNGNKFFIDTLPKESKSISKDITMPLNEKYSAGTFVLKTNQPAQEATTGSRLSRLFFEPKRVLVKEAQTFTTIPSTITYGKSSNVIITDAEGNIANLVFTGTKREGSNILKVSRYEGQQIPLDIEGFSNLPKTQQYNLLKTTGGVFLEDNKYSVGGLQTTKFLRANLKTGETIFYPYGKRVQLNEIVSEAKPLIETPELIKYETKAGIKSSIKTQQRAIGNIGMIEGESTIYNAPVQDIGESQNQVLTNQNNLNTIKKIQVDVLKNIPKQQLTKAGKELKLLETPAQSIPANGLIGKTISLTIKSPKSLQVQPQKVLTIENQKQGTSQVQIPIQSNVSNLKEFTLLKTPQAQITIPSLEQKQFNKIGELNIQNFQQKQEQKSRLSDKLLSLFKPSTPETKQTTTTLIPPSSSEEVPKEKSILSKIKSAFNVSVKKGGKDIVIGRDLPKGKATKLGVETVIKTLRASYKLTPAGKTTQADIQFNEPADMFRGSKREAGLRVQLRNRRFSNVAGESKAAVKLRKGKRGKFKIW